VSNFFFFFFFSPVALNMFMQKGDGTTLVGLKYVNQSIECEWQLHLCSVIILCEKAQVLYFICLVKRNFDPLPTALNKI
jgi:hypothetical protein